MVLIDRKKLEEQIKETFKENPVCMGMLLRWIRRQKSVDAAPVVHGEWVWTERGDEDYEKYWVCSKCGQQQYVETNYCPDCGAKMYGGKDAEE